MRPLLHPLARFAHYTHRYATNREAGLLLGGPRDPVRALHDRRAIVPSVPRHACLSEPPGKACTLPRMALPSRARVCRPHFIPRLRAALRLYVQRDIQSRTRARTPCTVALIRLARPHPDYPLCDHATELSTPTRRHSRLDGCIDDGGFGTRTIRLSAMGACAGCPCVVAPSNSAFGGAVV